MIDGPHIFPCCTDIPWFDYLWLDPIQALDWPNRSVLNDFLVFKQYLPPMTYRVHHYIEQAEHIYIAAYF